MKTEQKQTYICPMHPEVRQPSPGSCPKCKMDLVIEENASKPVLEKPKRTLRDFFPLIVIFSTIIGFTALMQIFVGGTDLEFGMRMFMGAFFAVFGFFKVINLAKFAQAYQMYDVVAQRSRIYAYVYPFLELMLAILYLANLGGIPRDVFTLVLMSVSLVGVVQKLREREEIPCACLGMVFILPMTWVTLLEDVLMAIEALIMIIIGVTKF